MLTKEIVFDQFDVMQESHFTWALNRIPYSHGLSILSIVTPKNYRGIVQKLKKKSEKTNIQEHKINIGKQGRKKTRKTPNYYNCERLMKYLETNEKIKIAGLLKKHMETNYWDKDISM